MTTALQLSRSYGRSFWRGDIRKRLARLAHKKGELGEAESHINNIPNNMSNLMGTFEVKIYRAKLAYSRGDLSKAIELLHEHRSSSGYAHSPITRANNHQTLSEVLVQQRNFEEAKRHSEASQIIYESVGNQLEVASCDRIKARLEFIRGNQEVAESHAQRAVNKFRGSNISDETADCLRILGLIALQQDNYETATDRLYEALERAEESGVVQITGVCHEAVTRLEAERGNPDETQYHREQAVEIFEQLGDTERARRIKATYSG
jgi:tetratricopeptide (TPR) repeat protein